MRITLQLPVQQVPCPLFVGGEAAATCLSALAKCHDNQEETHAQQQLFIQSAGPCAAGTVPES